MSAEGDGRLIGGRYRLVERIGSGGMGTVWLARDEVVGRDCAVKEPRLPGDPADPVHQRLCRRLQREARAAAQVEHPSAVSVHDVVTDGGLPWIVMELVRGESLHALLKRGALTPRETARIGLAVLGALDAAHAKGIVHRDVKPANVLLGPHGRVVLTDFGIARVQGEEPLTVSGEFVGSLESIAPERMQGVPAGPESDLWSLGVLLYAAVEGWSPFRRTTLESTLAAILQAAPPEPVQAGPLGDLIVKLLAKEPSHRPSAQEVERELAAVAEGRVSPLPGAEGSAEPRSPARHEHEPRPPAADAADPAPGSRASASPEPGSPDSGPERSGPPDSGSDPRPTSTATPSGLRRPRRALALAAAATVAVGAAVWGVAAVASGGTDNSGTPGAHGNGTPGPSSQPQMATPDAWRWRPHFESRLDAEISVPRSYRREAVPSEASLAADREITFAERGNPVWLRLARADRDPSASGPVEWAQRDLRRLMDGGEQGGRVTASQARGTVVPANHHGTDAAVLDVTYYAQEGDTARPVHRLAFYVVTAAQERYSVLVEMPKGGKEEAEGQDLFRGVRDRLKLGKAETSP
ncbi:serine/threonine-protein kinase [Streptomyces sp. NPDC058685]|uniref:serine/threonine-protein kinase n=1 Tax=Streptomyces sp. NPDC058685 TaxID=3346598 RepID=UPI003660FA4B